MKYQKILIAVDNSNYSVNAAEKGLYLAAQLNADVALVFVVEIAKAVGNIDAGILPEEALSILKKEAEQSVLQIEKAFPDQKIMKFFPEGFPKEEILKTSETWGADVIVMGTHGRTGLKHLLLGSISEYIVRHSKVPVLVVPLK